jgi:hypothetical protein
MNTLHALWELLKLDALNFILIGVAEIVEHSSGSFTSPYIQSPPRHVIEVLVVLHLAAILLIQNADHYY